jgi:hypothetical protein
VNESLRPQSLPRAGIMIERFRIYDIPQPFQLPAHDRFTKFHLRRNVFVFAHDFSFAIHRCSTPPSMIGGRQVMSAFLSTLLVRGWAV